jgi:ferritin-like metal-binding protein YciE
MSQSERKIVQYLNEAHATEVGLVRVLQSQIAMTPGGSYRAGLEEHLRETEAHAERVQARLGELDASGNPLLAGIGFMESALSQTLAFWKTPLDLLRGASGEEKVLKNAKDACAAEALEIATYTALEHLAQAVGDDTTAELAASIRGDEERMLEFVVGELPNLARAVVRSEVDGSPSYDIAETGAAEAARETATAATRVARSATAGAKRPARQARRSPAGPARQARRSPAAAQAAPRREGTAASTDAPPIARYDDLTVEEIGGKLAELSQTELAKVDAYERKHDNRSTVLTRIGALKGDEPWPGYDELTVEEIVAAVGDDDQRASAVRSYERAHKNRAGVLTAVDRELANA